MCLISFEHYSVHIHQSIMCSLTNTNDSCVFLMYQFKIHLILKNRKSRIHETEREDAVNSLTGRDKERVILDSGPSMKAKIVSLSVCGSLHFFALGREDYVSCIVS